MSRLIDAMLILFSFYSSIAMMLFIFVRQRLEYSKFLSIFHWPRSLNWSFWPLVLQTAFCLEFIFRLFRNMEIIVHHLHK